MVLRLRSQVCLPTYAFNRGISYVFSCCLSLYYNSELLLVVNDVLPGRVRCLALFILFKITAEPVTSLFPLKLLTRPCPLRGKGGNCDPICLNSCVVVGEKPPLTCCVWRLTQDTVKQYNACVDSWADRDIGQNTQRCFCGGTGEKATFHRHRQYDCSQCQSRQNVYSESMGFIVVNASSPVAEEASLPRQSMSDHHQVETIRFL